MPTLVEPATKGKSPVTRKLTQDQVISRSLSDKANHLSSKIDRLGKVIGSGESLRRTKQALTNVKESKSKL